MLPPFFPFWFTLLSNLLHISVFLISPRSSTILPFFIPLHSLFSSLPSLLSHCLYFLFSFDFLHSLLPLSAVSNLFLPLPHSLIFFFASLLSLFPAFSSILPTPHHSSSPLILSYLAGLSLLSHFSATVCKHFCIRGRDKRKTGHIIWGPPPSQTVSSSEFVEADEKHSWKCETFRWGLLTPGPFKCFQCSPKT